jgi:hypothetical protein
LPRPEWPVMRRAWPRGPGNCSPATSSPPNP